MAFCVYGKEGDDVIVTRIDFGYGDEFLVEKRIGYGYATIASFFSEEKAIKKAGELVDSKNLL